MSWDSQCLYDSHFPHFVLWKRQGLSLSVLKFYCTLSRELFAFSFLLESLQNSCFFLVIGKLLLLFILKFPLFFSSLHLEHLLVRCYRCWIKLLYLLFLSFSLTFYEIALTLISNFYYIKKITLKIMFIRVLACSYSLYLIVSCSCWMNGIYSSFKQPYWGTIYIQKILPSLSI